MEGTLHIVSLIMKSINLNIFPTPLKTFGKQMVLCWESIVLRSSSFFEEKGDHSFITNCLESEQLLSDLVHHERRVLFSFWLTRMDSWFTTCLLNAFILPQHSFLTNRHKYLFDTLSNYVRFYENKSFSQLNDYVICYVCWWNWTVDLISLYATYRS